jgi:hypothetical protein
MGLQVGFGLAGLKWTRPEKGEKNSPGPEIELVQKKKLVL